MSGLTPPCFRGGGSGTEAAASGVAPAAETRRRGEEEVAMTIQIARTESGSWARAVACFLCLMGLPFLIVVLADVRPVGAVVISA